MHVTDSISRSYSYIDWSNICFRKPVVPFLTCSQSNNIIQHSVHFVNKHSSNPDLWLSSCQSYSLIFWTLTLATYCSSWYTFMRQSGINYFVTVAWYITLTCKFVFKPAKGLLSFFLHEPLNVQFLQVNSPRYSCLKNIFSWQGNME